MAGVVSMKQPTNSSSTLISMMTTSQLSEKLPMALAMAVGAPVMLSTLAKEVAQPTISMVVPMVETALFMVATKLLTVIYVPQSRRTAHRSKPQQRPRWE